MFLLYKVLQTLYLKCINKDSISLSLTHTNTHTQELSNSYVRHCKETVQVLQPFFEKILSIRWHSPEYSAGKMIIACYAHYCTFNKAINLLLTQPSI